jgi:predicted esterase
MVWAPGSTSVFADDVTLRYLPRPAIKSATVAAVVDKIHSATEMDAALLDAPLSREEATEVRKLLWDAHVARIRRERTRETLIDKCVRAEGKEMPFSLEAIGNAGPGVRRPLIISLHGGGGCPKAVNDQQWGNQQRLYRDALPPVCLYVCPRGPTDNWNLWHEAHVDTLLVRLIENLIVLEAADPDRVYLVGYSAGGDGVYKLSPRLASLFAGASMMAGHPNGEPLLGLRNLPFAICVGSQDGAYNRNTVGKEYATELERLARQDGSDGYQHYSMFPPTGHWMNGADGAAVKWICGFVRISRPRRVVWKQNSDVLHGTFYNLSTEAPQRNACVCVEQQSLNPQEFVVSRREGVTQLSLFLDDVICNLDEPVIVREGAQVLFHGLAPRTARSIRDSVEARGDPAMMFDATVNLVWR